MVPTHELINDYLQLLENGEGLTAGTIRRYRYELNQLVRHRVALEAESLAMHVSRRQDGNPVAPSTRNWRIRILRRFMLYVGARGLVDGDPMADIKTRRIPSTTKTPLGPLELRRVLNATAAARWSWLRARDTAIVLVLYNTGLRVAELVRLDVQQVDFAAGVLRSTHKKGGTVADTLLNAEAMTVLDEWLQQRPVDAGPLFTSSAGTRLTVRAVQRRLARLGELAGLKVRLHPHALRHAYATALLGVGVSVRHAQRLLHHASIRTTARYLHVNDAELRAAVARIPPVRFGTAGIRAADNDH